MTPILETEVDKTGVLAAFPRWTVDILSAAGGAQHTVDNVPDGPNADGIVRIGEILRQAKADSRGTITVVLEATPDAAGARWVDDFDATDPLEGSTVTVTVVSGAFSGAVFVGVLDEVVHDDHTKVEVRVREGGTWAESELLTPIDAATWPDAPEESLARHEPFVIGTVVDYVPLLVEDDRITALEASMTTSATSATVASTAGFPSSGSLRINDETLTYASTTPTTFDGLVRAAPESHAPGAAVVEVGDLVYMVAGHALYGTTAVENLRLVNSLGELVPVPGTVGVVISAAAPATITLDAQPEIETAVAQPPGLAFIDLDTVAHSDLPSSEAEKALGLADGYTETNHADLTGSEATGGQRVASVVLPTGGQVSRAWVVIESFGVLEAETALTSGIDDVVTTIPVADTTAFPAAGHIVIESGSQSAELVSYSGTTPTSFTGAVRGLNTDVTGAVSHPSGARVSHSTGRVHLNLTGGSSSDSNALGFLEVKPTPPEEAACELIPAAHGFSSFHTHNVPAHTHTWDSSHDHALGLALRVDGLGTAVKMGQGGPTGSPVVQGIGTFTTLPGLTKPEVADFHDIAHTNVPIIPGSPDYDRTQWYAVVFPAGAFAGDTRRVLGADFYVAASGTGGNVDPVFDAVPSGAPNGPLAPFFHASSFPAIPPEATSGLLNAGALADLGDHGTWQNEDAITTLSPADGGDLDLVDVSSVDAFDVWGGDEGTDSRRSLPMAEKGYILLTDGIDTEIVRYDGIVWVDTAGEVIRLENISRGAYGSTKVGGAANALDVTSFPTRGWYPVRFTNVGTGKGGLTPADDGPPMADIFQDPGQIRVYQSRLGPIFDAIEASHEPALFRPTVGDFMEENASVVPGGSRVPFDASTTNIEEQYGGSAKIMPHAPVLWIRAHTGINVHAAWIELLLEDLSSEEEADDGLDPASQAPDTVEALGTSTLSWFDVSDLVTSASDLEGATIRVERKTALGSDDLLLLRMFHVLEVEGAVTTRREYPKRLVCDVRGAGISSDVGTCTAAEALFHVPVTGLGLVAGSVLDLASFVTVDPLAYQSVGLAVTEPTRAVDLVQELGDSFRITPRWGVDGKLGVAYRPDRSSLPAPAVTFDEEDVSRSTLKARRAKVSDTVTSWTVRAGRNMLDDDGPLLTGSASSSAARPDTFDAPAIIVQTDADDLAAHLLDYSGAVLDRVSWRTFTQGLGVLPGDVVGLSHPDRTTSGLFVERVRLNPSYGSPGFVTIEGRDLSPPP